MFTRLKLRRSIPKMSHKTAFTTLRSLGARGDTDGATMLRIAQRAVDTAPDGESCYHAKLWRDVYAAGRSVHTKSGGMLVSVDGVDSDLIDQINEIFQ